MRTNLNEYLKEEHKKYVEKLIRGKYPKSLLEGASRLAGYVVCADGLTFSAQASHTHYCTPRNNDGPWTHVEIGFPSAPIPEFEGFRDTPDSPVFGWTPVSVVEEVIRKHGGMK